MDACDRDRNQDKQFEQIFALIKKKILSNVTLHCSFGEQTSPLIQPKTFLRNIIPLIYSSVKTEIPKPQTYYSRNFIIEILI